MLLFSVVLLAQIAANAQVSGLKGAGSDPQILQVKVAPGSEKGYAAYYPVFVSVQLKATYRNPFDPDQVRLNALITGPHGIAMTMPGFITRAYKVASQGQTDVLEPNGQEEWQVRFTPTKAGRWTFHLVLRDQNGEATSQTETLSIKPSDAPGFIHRSRRNPLYFSWSDGKPYFAVGENMAWDGGDWQRNYTTWLTALGGAGGNWIRLWMAPWSLGIEWSTKAGHPPYMGEYHGLGRYNLGNAWKLDWILNKAAQNHVNVMLTLGTYGEFLVGGYFHEGIWDQNPYNQANGGPCATPNDFWTNPTAIKLYQQRLRYLIARYAYHTNLVAWELWNEENAPPHWVAQMSAYLKTHDPYHHLVTTTYGNPEVWRLPDIDFTQTRTYGTGDIPDHAPVIHADVRANIDQYHKPHMVGEFGIDWRSSDAKYDPDGLGINLHNGLWSATMSGAPGGAMIWYWDNYVQPKNLYHEFTALANFAKTVDWTAHHWRNARIDAPIVESAKQSYRAFTMPAGFGWGKAPHSNLTITAQGIADGRTLAGYLYSKGKADLRTTPVLHVDYPEAGTFTVNVHQVSNWGELKIWLDGKVALDQKLMAEPGKGNFKRTTFESQYGIYLATYNKSFTIPVSVGPHTIRLDNAGGDWISIASVTLDPYSSNEFPPINVYGLQDSHSAILWFQNAQHNWKNAYKKRPCPPIAGARTALHGLRDGRYELQWWNTAVGAPFLLQKADCSGGELRIAIPTLTSDVALKVYPAAH